MPKCDRSTSEATLAVSAKQHTLSLVVVVLGGGGDRVGDPCGICEAARVGDRVVAEGVKCAQT